MKPTIEPTELDRAFLAGLIDAEGHIEITHNRPSGMKRTYFIEVTIGNSCKELLEWCVARFGGFICANSYKKDFGLKRASIFRWRTAGSTAARVLEGCMPYLIGKIEQARIALEFQSTMQKSKTPLTEEIMRKREDCWRRLRELTKTGRRPVSLNSQVAVDDHTLDSKPQLLPPSRPRPITPTLFDTEE